MANYWLILSNVHIGSCSIINNLMYFLKVIVIHTSLDSSCFFFSGLLQLHLPASSAPSEDFLSKFLTESSLSADESLYSISCDCLKYFKAFDRGM